MFQSHLQFFTFMCLFCINCMWADREVFVIKTKGREGCTTILKRKSSQEWSIPSRRNRSLCRIAKTDISRREGLRLFEFKLSYMCFTVSSSSSSICPKRCGDNSFPSVLRQWTLIFSTDSVMFRKSSEGIVKSWTSFRRETFVFQLSTRRGRQSAPGLQTHRV